MADHRLPTFSLWRFLLRVVPLAIGAGVLWKLTATENASFTVWLTKMLHGLAGRPAPYMFCDSTHLFWHATMFPPVVALMLGSYWIRWPGRVLRAAAGYVVQCGMTAIAITINESPYLQRTPLCDTLTSTLVNANYLMFGVVIWVLAAGPWYVSGRESSSRGMNSAGRVWWRRAVSAVRHGWWTRVVLLWVAVALVVPVFALSGSTEGRAARARVAAAMSNVPFFPQPSGGDTSAQLREQLQRDEATKHALYAIEAAIKADPADGSDSAALFYLTAHLLNSLRPPDANLRQQFRADALLMFHKATEARAR